MISQHNKHKKKKKIQKKIKDKKRECRILPYIKNNKVYFREKLQREGILSGLLAKVIP